MIKNTAIKITGKAFISNCFGAFHIPGHMRTKHVMVLNYNNENQYKFVRKPIKTGTPQKRGGEPWSQNSSEGKILPRTKNKN